MRRNLAVLIALVSLTSNNAAAQKDSVPQVVDRASLPRWVAPLGIAASLGDKEDVPILGIRMRDQG